MSQFTAFLETLDRSDAVGYIVAVALVVLLYGVILLT
jgi:flagellar motor component MotA